MLVVTVTCALTAEVVTLHSTSEALTAAHCSHVDFLALDELINSDLSANFESVNALETKLDETTT